VNELIHIYMDIPLARDALCALGTAQRSAHICVHTYHVYVYVRAMQVLPLFGGGERCAQGATVLPGPHSLAQDPPRISSFCVCALVLFVYEPSVGVTTKLAFTRYSFSSRPVYKNQ